MILQAVVTYDTYSNKILSSGQQGKLDMHSLVYLAYFLMHFTLYEFYHINMAVLVC